jgi:hypothetical protein
MGFGFYPILGWGVFWIGFIVSIILFAKYKKLYPVLYLMAVALYIFTAGFAIDVFEFGKFGILITLVFSAVLSMMLGYYLSQVIHLEPAKSSK